MVVAVPVVFEVLWMIRVIGYEVVRGVVVLTGVGRGPQCTLDRGQKPLVVTRRQQQVVQDLLVRLALLEAATQRIVASPAKPPRGIHDGDDISFFRSFFFFSLPFLLSPFVYYRLLSSDLTPPDHRAFPLSLSLSLSLSLATPKVDLRVSLSRPPTLTFEVAKIGLLRAFSFEYSSRLHISKEKLTRSTKIIPW